MERADLIEIQMLADQNVEKEVNSNQQIAELEQRRSSPEGPALAELIANY
jgi:hypothetical protein